MHSYTHTSSTGEQTEVFLGDGLDRWVAVPGHPGRKMMLPYPPNTVHGRYFAEQLAKGLDRRAYRRLHDDYMLATDGRFGREWDNHETPGICKGECREHGV